MVVRPKELADWIIEELKDETLSTDYLRRLLNSALYLSDRELTAAEQDYAKELAQLPSLQAFLAGETE